MIKEAGEMVVYVAGYPAIRGVQPLFFTDSELVRRSRIRAPDIVHRAQRGIAGFLPLPRPARGISYSNFLFWR